MFVFVPIIPHAYVSSVSYGCFGPYSWIYIVVDIICLILFMSILSSLMKK